MKHLRTLALITLFALGTCSCSEEPPVVNKHFSPSKLWMPVILSDGMVVQQNSVATFWGTTNPNATVTGLASWSEQNVETTADADGRWKLDIPTPAASMKEYSIHIKDSHGGLKYISGILIGEVWHFAGQSNMEMPMRGFGSVANGNYQPVTDADKEIASSTSMSHFRYFKVGYQPSDTLMYDVRNNKWWKASSTTDAKEYSAIAFFAGRKIASELNVPVGIICTPYGGTRIEAWMPAERVRTFKPDEYKEASELSESAAKKSAPGLLYNGMVHPIQNYTIRGWAWYQGESNRDNSFAYARLQQAMVDEWRKAKGDTNAEIPFYYVQISGTGKNTDTYGADLIQAQWDALKLIPNSGIVTSSDCGDQVQGVHYPNKKTPGERLGNLILHDVYGRTDLKVAPPMVESVKYEGGKATVSFSNGEGLHATGSTIPYVQLVDAAGNLHTATATIVNGKMEVTCASVAEAKGVRYCYMSWHLSTVFNDAGIPLAPFKHSK
ncbi:MAG: hypothetical protein IIV29_05175 [Tidjanibacter sp.]|nr:hypothetical protein [Tidjanibacter sp.]